MTSEWESHPRNSRAEIVGVKVPVGEAEDSIAPNIAIEARWRAAINAGTKAIAGRSIS